MWSMQCEPMPWLPPEQHDALGQHPFFFTQHSGVSDALLPVAEEIPNGATITVARIASSANFFMTELLLHYSKPRKAALAKAPRSSRTRAALNGAAISSRPLYG